jgi:hypothetical protein
LGSSILLGLTLIRSVIRTPPPFVGASPKQTRYSSGKWTKVLTIPQIDRFVSRRVLLSLRGAWTSRLKRWNSSTRLDRLKINTRQARKHPLKLVSKWGQCPPNPNGLLTACFTLWGLFLYEPHDGHLDRALSHFYLF